MIELTPLDVRKKRGDFRKGMRGYDPGEVDSFLEIVAERLEFLVKENLTLKERTARLSDQVREQQDREKAVQDALVTAQALRKDISGQAQREAELMRREAEAEIERMLMDAENRLDELRLSMDEMDRRRRRFLRAVRAMLERELDFVSVEEGRDPLEEKPLELELFVGRSDGGEAPPRPWDTEEEEPGELLGADEEPAEPGSREPRRPAYASVAGGGEASSVEHAPTPERDASVPASTAAAGTVEATSNPVPPTVPVSDLSPTHEGAGADASSPAEGAQTEPRPKWEPHWRFTLGEGGTKGSPGD